MKEKYKKTILFFVCVTSMMVGDLVFAQFSPGVFWQPERTLELILPASSSAINLQSFIATNNPDGVTKVIVTNNSRNPQIYSGDLSAYEVTLVNNSSILGMRASKNALVLTSSLKLINNGVIRGGGGSGGAGGKGANDTYTTSSSETRYNLGCGSGNSWAAHTTSTLATIVWDSDWVNVDVGDSTGPTTHSSYPGYTFYRGAHKTIATCETTSDFYEIIRVLTTTHTRTGGAGGAGGLYGAAFESDTPSTGSAGAGSSPSGGYSGGTGGSGGAYGAVGNTGARGDGSGTFGSAGTAPGYSISGTAYLLVDSVTGSITGPTQ